MIIRLVTEGNALLPQPRQPLAVDLDTGGSGSRGVVPKDIAHGDDLPGLVLVHAGYPDVAVLYCHSSLAAFPLIDGNGITKAGKTIPPAAISGEMRGYFHVIGNHPAPTVPMALTHTVTHTTKRVDGNSGEDRTYLP